MCVYAKDEAAFFDSSDIQQLNIGSILTPGHLIPDDIQPSTNNELLHNYVQLTVSVSPEMCKDLMSNLFPLLLPEKRDGGSDGGLILEIRVKATEYWQSKLRFLLNSSQEITVQNWLISQQCVVRKKNCVGHYCLPDKHGPAWERARDGLCAKRGMVHMDEAIKTMLEPPCLQKDAYRFAFKSYNVRAECCVPQTIETLAFPLPTANPIVMEMILCAMSQTESSTSASTYQMYIKETKTLRDNASYDLPATLLSSLSQYYTPN